MDIFYDSTQHLMKNILIKKVSIPVIFLILFKYTYFLNEPVNSELRLPVLNFLRIFSLNCS